MKLMVRTVQANVDAMVRELGGDRPRRRCRWKLSYDRQGAAFRSTCWQQHGGVIRPFL
jgi:hypothetical protein